VAGRGGGGGGKPRKAPDMENPKGETWSLSFKKKRGGIVFCAGEKRRGGQHNFFLHLGGCKKKGLDGPRGKDAVGLVLIPLEERRRKCLIKFF